MLISVVIPVYNAEKFLSKSIESVINQSYKNLEIILVDDGSTDESKKMCEEYAIIDERIKVISKKNGGPATARNMGVCNATGEVVFFLDADDFILKYTLEELIDVYNQYHPDLVMANFNKLINNKEIIKQEVSFRHNEKPFGDRIKILLKKDIQDYIRHFLKYPSNHLISYCWARLYKLSIIKENNLLAKEDMRLFEDFVFNLDYLKYTNKIAFLNENLYIYTMHDSHISVSMSILNGDSLIHDMNLFKEKTKEFFNNSKNVKKEIGHALIHYAIIFLVRSCRQVNRDTRKKLHKEIKKLIKSRIIKESLKYYSPSKGNSRFLPLLMKYKLTDLIIPFCKYKASKRYGKLEENKC